MAPPRRPTLKETGHRVTSINPDANSPLPDANKSNITTLPNELLMPIARHLAFDKAQAYLDSVSFQGYIQCQKDLRNLCLVSKQMDAVARQYLYRAVIVKNSDVLVYLARTLGLSPGLGHLVKQLVFEVPFNLEDVRYRKPYVGVLAPLQTYSRVCQMAVEAFDPAKFEAYRLDFRKRFGRESGLTFREWAGTKEREILWQLHWDIIIRLSNLQLLCFGMLDDSQTRDNLYEHLQLGRVTGPLNGQSRVSQLVAGPGSKLQQLQLFGDNRDGKKTFSGFCLRGFLEIPSLQVLKCVSDDGNMYNLDPHQGFRFPMPPPGSWQCKNITCIDFRRSRCTPAAIFHLCATFPSLQCFSVSVERGTAAKDWSGTCVEASGAEESLSSGLSKLEHLRELNLDLHYRQNIRPLLGEHGILSLGGLNKLTNVRLPLHYLVEAQTASELRVTDLAVVLPPSVKHLAVWADLDCVGSWDKGPPSTNMFSDGPPPTPGVPYHPRQSALDFMESVCNLPHHFKHLKEAVYCFGGQALDTPCQCNADTLCSRCEASELLDLQATDDSATRMQILASICETRGLCLRTLQEQIEG